MLKNRRLSRAIAAAGWSGPQTKVDDRLKRQGRWLVRVEQWFPHRKPGIAVARSTRHSR